MYFHYKKNKEISSNIKYLKPNIKLIKAIYKIGLSATLMQTLLAIMMSGMNAILNLASTTSNYISRIIWHILQNTTNRSFFSLWLIKYNYFNTIV